MDAMTLPMVPPPSSVLWADAAGAPDSSHQSLEPGPQVAEALDHVHRGEAFYLTAVLQFVHQVDRRPFTQGSQCLLITGRQVSEPRYQGGEGAEFVAARPDPG